MDPAQRRAVRDATREEGELNRLRLENRRLQERIAELEYALSLSIAAGRTVGG